ncbi:hypothetical protein ACFSJS_17050 [Streptomyces desertarenae]|uniref:Uncharacterized protein n=1 Tax=Streptomyces desertarenae TaxID=2666184 RepID=A0ABW4PM41_9ACTN
MPTLEELTTGDGALLRAVAAPGRGLASTARPRARKPAGAYGERTAARVIEQVGEGGPDRRLRPGAGRARNTLAVLPAGNGPPGRPQSALRALARAGAVAVASPGEPGTAVAEAAREAGLPLLVPARTCTAPELLNRPLRRLTDALRESVGQRDRLLELSARPDRQGGGRSRCCAG